MNKLHILSLVAFNCPKGAQEVEIAYVIGRLKWVVGALKVAATDPDSSHARAVRETGFVTIVLKGPQGYEHIEAFDHGHAVVVSKDGRSAEYQAPEASRNIAEALTWATTVLRYGQWCLAVEIAKKGDRRPPVWEHSEGTVSEDVERWIGQKAMAYRAEWASKAHLRAAERVAQGALVQS